MDRLNELLPPAARRDRDEDGYPDASYSEAIHVCENCRQPAERLTLVPEFEYMGCDDCIEEALAIIAKEARPDYRAVALDAIREVAVQIMKEVA